MRTRNIGSLDVSVIGLGTNSYGVDGRIDERQSAKVLNTAIDLGINFIDTADVYGQTNSETIIGNTLGSRRSEVVLATKFGIKIDDQRPGGGKPEYVRSAVEDSLRRLSTDYIDLYIYHRPDPDTPIEDTLVALGELVEAGKVRELGCSQFTVKQLQDACAAAKEGGPCFVNLQSRYSVLYREVEEGVLAECGRQSVSFVPWAPLAAGLLSGKYRKEHPLPGNSRIVKYSEDRRNYALRDENLEVVENLYTFAEDHGHTILELAISWLYAQPLVTAIVMGATTPEQVRANVGAASWQLTPEELSAIDRIAPVGIVGLPA